MSWTWECKRMFVGTERVFEVSNDAAKSLGFLKQYKNYFSAADIRNIYDAYIRRKLLHACVGESIQNLVGVP